MKKRRLIITGVLAALAGLLVTGFAYGYRSFFSPAERIDHITKKITRELNLDAGQQQVLEEIATAVKEKITEMRGEHDQAHGRTLALIRQDQLTEADVMDLVAEHHRRFEPVAEFAAEQIVRFHNVLTVEQREQLAKAIEEHARGGGRCRFGQ